ncbi:MAG: CHRD domain-containing protein [Deinococcota bacterium]
MKTIWRVGLAILISLLLAACSSDDDSTITYTFTLEGEQEVPDPVDTDATGSVTVVLDEETNVMTLNGSVSNLSSPLLDVADAGPAHIHEAPRGENGGIAFVITVTNRTDTSATLSLTETLNDDQVELLKDGQYYVNIHTENFGAGELRGQIE